MRKATSKPKAKKGLKVKDLPAHPKRAAAVKAGGAPMVSEIQVSK